MKETMICAMWDVSDSWGKGWIWKLRGNKIRNFVGKKRTKGKSGLTTDKSWQSRKVRVHSTGRQGSGHCLGCGTKAATEDGLGYVWWAVWDGLCGAHLLGWRSCWSNLVKRKQLLSSSGSLVGKGQGESRKASRLLKARTKSQKDIED